MLIVTADPNVKIEQGEKGLYLDHVDVPISMRDSNNVVQGGIRLTPEEDNISLADNFDKFKELAITKMKKLVAEAQVFSPEPEPEYVPDDEPVQSEAPVEDTPASEAPQSEATSEAPASEATSEATSEAMSEAPVSETTSEAPQSEAD